MVINNSHTKTVRLATKATVMREAFFSDSKMATNKPTVAAMTLLGA